MSRWLVGFVLVVGACAPSPSDDRGAGDDDSVGDTDSQGDADPNTDSDPQTDADPHGDSDPQGDADSQGPAILGSATIARRIHASGPATGTLTTPAVATLPGSLLLASAARGQWDTAPSAPSDDQANAFTLLGSTHPYASWPTSRTGLYVSENAAASAMHHFSLAWGDVGGAGDEVSLSVVEVRGATEVLDDAWVERGAATSLTSAAVTVDGPALLVAWWWGSGGVRAVGTSHVAVPGDEFTLVEEATGLSSLSLNGYIQVAVASRSVTEAGSYTISWTTDDEGAQLYLVAVR